MKKKKNIRRKSEDVKDNALRGSMGGQGWLDSFDNIHTIELKEEKVRESNHQQEGLPYDKELDMGGQGDRDRHNKEDKGIFDKIVKHYPNID